MDQPAPARKRTPRKTPAEPLLNQPKPSKRPPAKPASTQSKVKKTTKPRTGKKSPKNTEAQKSSLRKALLLGGLEALALTVSAVVIIVVLLGYGASRFSGSQWADNLLPFALGVLALVLIGALVLIAWWKLRQWLNRHSKLLMPLLAVSLALTVGWFAINDKFTVAFGHFKTLVGGKHEAERVTLTHQVFAAYRRQNQTDLHSLLTRAQPYGSIIAEAARAFDVDADLLAGVAATESSFLPRDSQDGGRGLFQITLVPKSVLAEAAQSLAVDKPQLNDPRHNAFVAAATLRYYLAQMNNDLFLGLLAYNIGPTNGGLRFIMQQYGVTDFVTIQPYLQQLPRDYPIRVLTYALAFRLWQNQGRLLAYEEGNNAIKIQRMGIPGL